MALIHNRIVISVPSEPIVSSVKNNGDSWFFLTWEPPDRVPGILEEFEINIEWEPLYPVPPWCTIEESVKPIKLDAAKYSYNYTKAKAFANYTVWMRAKTGAGWGNPSERQTFRTKYGGTLRSRICLHLVSRIARLSRSRFQFQKRLQKCRRRLLNRARTTRTYWIQY